MAGALSWTHHDYRNRVFNGVKLSPMQAEILSLFVIRHGWPRSELEEIIWGDAEDGGPLGMRVTLSTHFSQINRKIAPWRIRSLRQGYAIIELAEVLELTVKDVCQEEALEVA